MMKDGKNINCLAVLAVASCIYIVFYNFICICKGQGKILESFANITFSFVAAYLFYLLQIILPERMLKKKAHIMLQPDVYNIYSYIYFFIAFTDKTFKFDNKELIINGVDRDIIYYKHIIDDKLTVDCKNYKLYFSTFNRNLHNYIHNLRNREYYKYLDDRLISIISEIDIENYVSISSVGKNYPKIKCFDGLKKEIKSLKRYKEQIEEFSNMKCNYKIDVLFGTEREKIKKDYCMINN